MLESIYMIAMIIVAYLFGSISTAVLTCKVMGLEDPRSAGSNNPGATNVLRIGGKKAAIITLIGDAIKGVPPVLLAISLDLGDTTIALTGFAAFLGHLFPIFFGFKGGKGVATAIGVLLATNWMVGLAAIATWIFMAVVFRYSSLAALTAASLAPVYVVLFGAPQAQILAFALMAALLVYRHKSNIQNLLAGKEGKIGDKKKKAAEAAKTEA